jgi:transposase
MGNRRISPDLKECALRLWELGWEEADIVQTLAVSRASIYRWRKIFEEFGTTTNPHARLAGRPSTITRAVLTAVHDVYKGEADLYLKELQFWLAIHHDIAISIPALQKTLAANGLTRKLLQKIARERDAEKCRIWAESINDDFDNRADYFVTVDETSKNEHTLARSHGRALVGERAVVEADFVRGPRYSVGAAMTPNGYIAVKVVPGSFDALMFFDFITESVVRPQSSLWDLLTPRFSSHR